MTCGNRRNLLSVIDDEIDPRTAAHNVGLCVPATISWPERLRVGEMVVTMSLARVA
jgi:hypothetical protein